MLIDNKVFIVNPDNGTVFDFLEKYGCESGKLDVVTGYFSIRGLVGLIEKLNAYVTEYRLIIGDLTDKEDEKIELINLLAGVVSLTAFELPLAAEKAVNFLKQSNVAVKTLKPHFCHAKLYVFKSEDVRHSFYILGSSNLTESGLGIKPQGGNLELNHAITGENNDYREAQTWFDKLWNSPEAKKHITVAQKRKVLFKDYLIGIIADMYRELTPRDIYYRILYVLYHNTDITSNFDDKLMPDIKNLENSAVFSKLYEFQRKGVLTLIRMMQRYGGAILGDAVGLGKTWQALAVMKFFQEQGYKVILVCPKKLEANWNQYLEDNDSIFESDKLQFWTCLHTDMQNERYATKENGRIKTFLNNRTKHKLLLVIDESHNFRNDKSTRYKTLINDFLKVKNDVKVLLLSATPINNRLTDVRNQFKLIAKGENDGFKQYPDLEVTNLEYTFRKAEEVYKKWEKKGHSIRELIEKLPHELTHNLADKLIVARTRKMIEKQEQALRFPEKDKPKNKFEGLVNLFDENSTGEDILSVIAKINFTAYRPADYMEPKAKRGEAGYSVLADEAQRQHFLAKMMFVLLVKRLESSWFALDITVQRVLEQHKSALSKIELYRHDSNQISILEGPDEDDIDAIEELQADDESTENTQSDSPLTIGKKNPVKLSDIKRLDDFEKDLKDDIDVLQYLSGSLQSYRAKIEAEFAPNLSADRKLEDLMKSVITPKLQQTNKKIIIFTAFGDTAEYIFNQLKKRGFNNIAIVTGTKAAYYLDSTETPKSFGDFKPVLERFAPFTKLYKERSWDHEYEKIQNAGQTPPKNYIEWKQTLRVFNPDAYDKVNRQIDILIATDCLSEGQNLQDADMIVNYDIHWNPVRLIQRMGRIDRIGSPNDKIYGVNYWPAKSFDDFLRLKTRVEKRMAAMTFVGAEVDTELTPELKVLTQDNPLITAQTQRMFEQLQVTWDDIDTGEQTLGLDDLAQHQIFRQDIADELRRANDKYKLLPNGVYSGFAAKSESGFIQDGAGIIALIGYPKKPEAAPANYQYTEYHLCYLTPNGNFDTDNQFKILEFFSRYKNAKRCMSVPFTENKQQTVTQYSQLLRNFITAKGKNAPAVEIAGLFEGRLKPDNLANQPTLDDKFNPHNFDLIAWAEVHADPLP